MPVKRTFRRKRKRTYRTRGRVPFAKRGRLRTGGFYRENGYGTTGELKFADEINNFGLIPISQVGTIVSSSLINTIQQGTGPSDRIGRKIQVKAIGLTFTMILPTTVTADDAGDSLRVILYLDRQANGAAALPTDILNTPIEINAFRELENVSRFNLLYDKTFSINASAGLSTGTGRHVLRRKMYLEMEYPVFYTGTGTSLSNIRSNNFGILVVSENASAIITITSRVRYTDM